MSTIRLMSQNQWNCTNNRPLWEEQGLDCSAEVRMKGHIQIFKDVMPDIVGGQEVNKDMQLIFKVYALEENLPYTIIWGNMTPIFYRADKFELLDTEYILYPATIEGYEGKFNDARSKSLNLGVFRDKASGKVFIFATTHLWWRGDNSQPGSNVARVQQVQQATALLAKYQEKYGGCPIVFVGDMNCSYTSDPIKYIMNEAGYLHAHDIAVDFRHEGRGYNGCNGNGPGVWQDRPFETAIDHILVKDAPEGSVKRFDRYCPDYYLPISDHAPVYIDFEI